MGFMGFKRESHQNYDQSHLGKGDFNAEHAFTA